MPSELQTDLFQPTLQQKFDGWRATIGGKHVLNLFYRRAAGYAARHRATGRRVSARLIWEQLRDHITYWLPRLRARRIPVAKLNGYRLNDHLPPYIVRHVCAHHPDWAGMFEQRTVGKPRRKRVITITEFTPARSATLNSSLSTLHSQKCA